MAGLAGCRNRTIAGVVDVWSEPGRVQRLSFRGRLAGHPAKLSAECPLAVFRQCRRQSLQWTAGGRRGHDGACFVVEVVRDCDRGEVRDPDDLVACPVRVVRLGAADRGEPRGLPVRAGVGGLAGVGLFGGGGWWTWFRGPVCLPGVRAVATGTPITAITAVATVTSITSVTPVASVVVITSVGVFPLSGRNFVLADREVGVFGGG